MLRDKRKTAYLCVWLVCVCLCACSGDADEVILIGTEEEVTEQVNEILDESVEDNSDVPETIFVYVCGAVISPGVVEVPQGSRVEDALTAVGGFAQDANKTYVNLADWVEDGQMLYFPTEQEVDSGQIRTSREQMQTSGIQSPASGEDVPVNINTADVTLLCTLPGIGESRAADIIAYREENGLFASCEDIMLVPGIKTGIYEKICHKITVD